MSAPAVRVIGPGRAGLSLSRALGAAGWTVEAPLGRADDVALAARGVDLLVLATPDAAIADVAAAVGPLPTTVVAHMAGSLGLDVLEPHPRRASLHPLVALPDPALGAERLRRAWFAVAGDPLVRTVVGSLGGRWFTVADEDRAAYHAAACIASNHLVALLGQAERVGAEAGVPREAFLELVRATVENVAALDPSRALTGPAARGDWDTIARHLAALDPSERPAYEAMVAAARRLVEPGPGLRGSAPPMRRQIREDAKSGMQVLDRIEGFRKELDAARGEGRSVGLVPTMGYLHEGHRSLIERSARECDVTAVTVFVNPLQFGANEDLAAYPRDLERDVALAEQAGAAIVFAPTVDEMYPGGPVLTSVRVGELSGALEGASRPGHFDGVATVVAKLFAIAGPCRAYFGEKDYQQLAVIRRMAADLSLPVDVVGCATVREPDGLALSSRNVYLEGDDRLAATVLHGALRAGAALVEAGERDPGVVRRRMAKIIEAEPRAALDYAEVVNAADLRTPERLSGELRLLVAARLGRARLIDNVGVST